MAHRATSTLNYFIEGSYIEVSFSVAIAMVLLCGFFSNVESITTELKSVHILAGFPGSQKLDDMKYVAGTLIRYANIDHVYGR